MNSLVSIIIPCFNDGRYLREAIQSAEQYPDPTTYEIVIVNDGSTDTQTLELLTALEREGYEVMHQRNRGLSAARNVGIKATRGSYILPLDSDNKIRPAYIREGVRLLEMNPRTGVVYGNAQHFGDRTDVRVVPDFSLGRLIQGNYVDACALYRRAVWEDVGGYDENMRLGWEDWDFWLRVALRNWGFFHVDAVLFDYRVRSNSLVSTTSRHVGELSRYIFSKDQLEDATPIRQVQQEITRLLGLEQSPDYRLGRAILNPLRRLRRFFYRQAPAKKTTIANAADSAQVTAGRSTPRNVP